MFIKLTLICLAFVPLIIGKASENPSESETRAGKSFGWLSVDNINATPLKQLVSANRRWKGELSLTFGRRPLLASVEFLYFRDKHHQHGYFAIENNALEQQLDGTSAASNDLDLSNAVASASDVSGNATEASVLDSMAEATQAPLSALKLEDYEEITFDPNVEANRVRREATQNEEVYNRESRAGMDGDDEVDSTTIDSSTTAQVMLGEHDSSENNFATQSPPAAASSHQNFYYVPSLPNFPYPPSRNPSAQHVSIAHHATHKPYIPVQNYFDFYPSQPDYNYHHSYIPYCISPFHHKFTPVEHDTWSNYRKWN